MTHKGRLRHTVQLRGGRGTRHWQCNASALLGTCPPKASVHQQRRPARREFRPRTVAIATLGHHEPAHGLPDRPQRLVGSGLRWSSLVGRVLAPAGVNSPDVLPRSHFFREWTPACRRGSPLADPGNLPSICKAVGAASRRWHHRLRLDEAVISSRGGATLFGLCEPLSPSPHLPTRVAPPPSRRCSRSQVARTQQVIKAVPTAALDPASFKERPSR